MSFGGPLMIAPMTTMLGIRPGMHVKVVNPPGGFLDSLKPLPEGCALLESATLGIDLTVFFSTRKTEVIEKLTVLMRGMAVTGSIWVAFPTTIESPVVPTEDFVRALALELGLTDVKKLMLNPEWTGLKLQFRPKNPRANKPQVTA